MSYGTLSLDQIDTSGNLTITGNVEMTGTLKPGAVLSTATNTAPVFRDSTGTEIGTLCRAWVNFNGVGTVAIRAAFNVSSITDNGTGDYSVNFTNAMLDVNYSPVISTSPAYSVTRNCSVQMASNGAAIEVAPTTSLYRFSTSQGAAAAGTAFDAKYICASFFR